MLLKVRSQGKLHTHNMRARLTPIIEQMTAQLNEAFRKCEQKLLAAVANGLDTRDYMKALRRVWDEEREMMHLVRKAEREWLPLPGVVQAFREAAHRYCNGNGPTQFVFREVGGHHVRDTVSLYSNQMVIQDAKVFWSNL